MAATREIPRLQKSFREEVIPKVLKEFGLKNAHQVPKVAKVIVSTGVGKRLENQKLKPEHREAVIDTYRKITGQNPIMIKAKKAVSNFKVREGSPSAFMVTLHALGEKSFDRGGSWAMGLTEQAVWPEINMANVNFSHGMHVNIVFENSDPKMSRFVLAELGMPFVRPEENSKKA